MSSHDYHDTLPGFDPAQLLHDGCRECEYRSGLDSHGIQQLDRVNFARAWLRAADWKQRGLPDISQAEAPMLNTLWAVQVQLERWGQPIGVLPVDPVRLAAKAAES
jgi:hypothetical protein